MVEDERPLVDSRGEAYGRRLDRPGRSEHGDQGERRCRREREAGAAELAAVLGPGEAQERQARVREQLGESQEAPKSASAGQSGAFSSSARAASIVSASSSRPSGSAAQPG